MKRHSNLLVATLTLGLLLGAQHASAADPVVATAPAQPMQKDQANAPGEDRTGRVFDPHGFFSFGGGVDAVGGELAKGISMNHVGAIVDLRVGFFLNRHFGIVGGVAASGGVGSVDNQGLRTYTLKFPACVELHAVDPKRGVYLDVGGSFFNAFVASAGEEGRGGSLSASNVFDLGAGVGYRFGARTRDDQRATGAGLDLHLGAQIGQYDKASSGDESGTILESKRSNHMTVALTVSRSLAF